MTVKTQRIDHKDANGLSTIREGWSAIPLLAGALSINAFRTKSCQVTCDAPCESKTCVFGLFPPSRKAILVHEIQNGLLWHLGLALVNLGLALAPGLGPGLLRCHLPSPPHSASFLSPPLTWRSCDHHSPKAGKKSLKFAKSRENIQKKMPPDAS